MRPKVAVREEADQQASVGNHKVAQTCRPHERLCIQECRAGRGGDQISQHDLFYGSGHSSESAESIDPTVSNAWQLQVPHRGGVNSRADSAKCCAASSVVATAVSD
jgi:hypothetical protein